MAVATLDHSHGGLADGEDVAGLHQISGIGAQDVDGVIQGAEQVGAQRQDAAAFPLAEVGLIGLQGFRTAQGHQHALTALQATEGSVIHPVGIHPEAVDPSGWGRAGDLDRDPGTRGFASFDDVSGPVAVCAGLLVGMVGNDPRFHLQAGGIRGPQQHGLDPQLRHKNLHAGVGVADLQHTLDTKPPAQIIYPPVARGHPQR